MNQVRGTNQAFQADFGLVGEMMEHQDAPAETIRAYLKGGPVGGEGIRSAGPRPCRVVRRGVRLIVFAVVKHNLEAPIGGQWGWRPSGQVRKIRSTVPVGDTLDVPLGRARQIAAVPLIGLGK